MTTFDYSQGTAPITKIRLSSGETVTEDGCRICELADGSFRFVWGGVSTRIGQPIPTEPCRFQTEEQGAELADSMEEAKALWNAYAMRLADSNPREAASMLWLTGVPIPQAIREASNLMP
jgi:hypothetical protein